MSFFHMIPTTCGRSGIVCRQKGVTCNTNYIFFSYNTLQTPLFFGPAHYVDFLACKGNEIFVLLCYKFSENRPIPGFPFGKCNI